MPKVLGVRIDDYNKKEALEKVSEFLDSAKSYKIFTPNPEMVVAAQQDGYFREVLNGGNLNICDGIGIKLVLRGKVEKISGSDFMIDICKMAEEKRKTVYLLGSGDDDVIKKSVDNLEKRFPELKVVGHNKGLKISYSTLDSQMIQYNRDENDKLVDEIIMSGPDILFVGMGHGKQEKWIRENLKDMPSVRIAMGVGGAFDFLSGKVKRAPMVMRKLGLEWFWRLIMEPWRIRRIWRATGKFIYLYASNRNS